MRRAQGTKNDMTTTVPKFEMQLPKFEMRFEAMTIEHLGLRLYNALPPVISELVSNAYDADSPRVEITVPTSDIDADSEVTVRDFGHAMTAREIQNDYLPIGRNRRGSDSSDFKSRSGRRSVTGRKGLGKLSCFGIADEMELRSIVGGRAITLKLNYPAMKAWPAGKPYEPVVVAERTGPTKDKPGVEIRMRGLRRKYKINPELLRKGLAQRLAFIGAGFQVSVNGTPIRPDDRVQRSECDADASWDISHLPHGAEVEPGHIVTGWIGFLAETSAIARGIDIFANEKAVELGSYFNFSSTHAQFSRAYLVGQISADFLDSPEGDLVATARNQVLWESPAAQALQKWGEKTLNWAFEQWIALRKKKKEERLIKLAKFDEWLKARQPREQAAAKRMVKLLVDDDRVDAQTAEPLLEVIKVSIESAAFADLLTELETKTASVATLLGLFAEWRVIEAREHLRLADGRLAVIEKLDGYIRTGALEVKEMQPLLRDNVWLLEPAWSEAQVEQHYTRLIAEYAKEKDAIPDKNRRIDILGVSDGKELTIVEIKKPQKTLELADLNQIEDYVDWARTNLIGTGNDSVRYVRGLLVVGNLGSSAQLIRKRERLEGSDIRVQTYSDLSRRSKEYYNIIEKRLRDVAPEYSRTKRQAQRLESPKKRVRKTTSRKTKQKKK